MPRSEARKYKVSTSTEIIRRLPGFEFVLLPDTGHMLMLERHDQVSAGLRALVGRVRRGLA